MKKQNIYKGLFDYQSEFSHKYACWANNHNGWAKMKKAHKRIAKKRLKRIGEHEQMWCDNCEYQTECEANEDFICPADESDDMWAITQGD